MKTDARLLAEDKRLKRGEDTMKAILEEWRKLIKAMYKAKEQGLDPKVIGRFFTHRREKYNISNVPEELSND